MKLLNYYIENFEPVKKGKDLYGLFRDCFQHLFTDKGYYFVKIQKEVLWNGASVPFLLRWFLPNWDKKDNRSVSRSATTYGVAGSAKSERTASTPRAQTSR